jgi:hypothetical protein
MKFIKSIVDIGLMMKQLNYVAPTGLNVYIVDYYNHDVPTALFIGPESGIWH